MTCFDNILSEELARRTFLILKLPKAYILKVRLKILRSHFEINPFMPSGLFYLNSLDQSISSLRDVWSVLISIMFYCILWRLIWVYTVCQCPIYGTLGTNGLIYILISKIHTIRIYHKVYRLFCYNQLKR